MWHTKNASKNALLRTLGKVILRTCQDYPSLRNAVRSFDIHTNAYPWQALHLEHSPTKQTPSIKLSFFLSRSLFEQSLELLSIAPPNPADSASDPMIRCPVHSRHCMLHTTILPCTMQPQSWTTWKDQHLENLGTIHLEQISQQHGRMDELEGRLRCFDFVQLHPPHRIFWIGGNMGF